LALRHLIPKETRDKINQAPATKYVVLLMMLVIGALIARHGYYGIRHRAIATKRGEFTDTTAVAIGLIYLAVGGMMVVGGLFGLVMSMVSA